MHRPEIGSRMTMTIDIDKDLERGFTKVCHEIGLSPSEAFGIFARAVVRERRIPFMHESTQERAMRSYELSISDGIARGIADMQTGDAISREDSRAMRTAR
jgi:addiction module RelB/DinJ family antitoxin